MKKLAYAGILGLLALNSCSKCYECTSQRTYNNQVDTVSQELCTADQKEIDKLENEGYTCSAN